MYGPFFENKVQNYLYWNNCFICTQQVWKNYDMTTNVIIYITVLNMEMHFIANSEHQNALQNK